MDVTDKDIIYSLGILLTLSLGAWNLFFNIRNTRRTNFINTVTNQRVKWIEQLRQDISMFSGLTYTWCVSNMDGEGGDPEILREVDRLRYLIRLRLNPSDEYDQRIEALLAEIPQYTNVLNIEKLKQKLEEFTVITQLLIKEEWEKVKKEAEHGNLI